MGVKKNVINNSKTNPYIRLKTNIFSAINNHNPIIATKTKPTNKNYERGYYTRFFCKRNNANNIYFEIDEKTYKSLTKQNSKYDFNLYTAGKIRWSIDGDIMKSNKIILSQLEGKFPNISLLFTKLNEFQKVRKTKGGELKYLDGKNYVGYYHIHLGKPMVGLFHSSKEHKNLQFINNFNEILPSNEPSFAVKNRIQINPNLTSGKYIAPPKISKSINNVVSQPTSPSYTPPTPTTGENTSGGGGGGY
tara:strand:+ start:4061 stop:4804 length:744 start_codon:yes stop_codon:yes gene_type:complete